MNDSLFSEIADGRIEERLAGEDERLVSVRRLGAIQSKPLSYGAGR